MRSCIELLFGIFCLLFALDVFVFLGLGAEGDLAGILLLLAMIALVAGVCVGLHGFFTRNKKDGEQSNSTIK